MFYVYVLKNIDGDIYIGQTNDLDDRLKRHNSGFSKSTKFGVPWSVVYHEVFNNRSEAVCREKELKGGKGREWLRSII